MPKKPSIKIDEEAALLARQTVGKARLERAAARKRKYKDIADKLARLKKLAAAHRGLARKRRRELGNAFAIAARKTEADTKAAAKFGKSRKLFHEACGDRPLRLFIECAKPTAPRKVARLITRALRLDRRSPRPEVELLYPRLASKNPDLARHLVVDLRLNRRRGLAIAPRSADAIRRSGPFMSVRIEGMRSGVTSGPPTTGTGPNYTMAEPARLDWHLTRPEDALLDSNPGDGRDYIGAIDAYGAWGVLGTQAGTNGASAGAGIVIGHPDSGYQPHQDYPAAQIDTVRAYDAFENASSAFAGFEDLDGIGKHPFEPLGFPYFVQHGTFTASVIVAPQENQLRDGTEMIGVAPGATMLPLRCVDTVILAGDLEIIRAVEHAVWADVDVISISLGGSPNPALLDALRAAIENGTIVVAAAGQPSGAPLPNQVVAPAAWPEVIAVGGAIGGYAWYGSFSGPEVDFCAPAVEINHATFSATGNPGDAHSQGTSFATALTAGVAALWLQHHGGRQAIMDAVPGRSVQQVFRQMARETAYRPSDLQSVNTDPFWPPGFGSGIIHARRLLEAALPAPEDVPGYNRSLPPNIYVTGSGIALADVNGRPVLDGIVMLQNAPAAIGTAIGAGGQLIGDFIANLTAGTSFAARSPVTSWLGAVGALRTLGEGAMGASVLAEQWEQALAAANSVTGELGEWLDDQADAAEKALNDAEDAIDEALDEAGDALEDFAEDTSEFLEDTAEDASETGSEIVEDVVEVFSSIWP